MLSYQWLTLEWTLHFQWSTSVLVHVTRADELFGQVTDTDNSGTTTRTYARCVHARQLIAGPLNVYEPKHVTARVRSEGYTRKRRHAL